MGKHPHLSETKATKGENEAILLQFNNPEELYANNPVKQEPLTHFQRGESCIPGSYRRSSLSEYVKRQLASSRLREAAGTSRQPYTSHGDQEVVRYTSRADQNRQDLNHLYFVNEES